MLFDPWMARPTLAWGSVWAPSSILRHEQRSMPKHRTCKLVASKWRRLYLVRPLGFGVLSTGRGVHMFSLDPPWVLLSWFGLTRKIPSGGKTYSLNEANANSLLRVGVIGCLTAAVQVCSRYIGSMVADVHRTLLEGGASFTPDAYPAS